MTVCTTVKNLLTFLILSCIPVLASAQSMQWAQRLGSDSSQSMSRATFTSDSGYVYVTGQFWGTIDFDPDTGTWKITALGNYDAFVAKYDDSGKLKWAKSIGSYSKEVAYGVTADSAGNVYVVGEFRISTSFHPGTTVSPLIITSNSNSIDAFIAKYDANGTVLWAKAVGGADDDFGYDVKVNPQGDPVFVGTYQGTVDFDPGSGTTSKNSYGGSVDAFFCRFNASGNFVWVEAIGGSGTETCRAIDIDAAGRIYITGSFTGQVDFDPNTGSMNVTAPGTGMQGYAACYTSAGAYYWVRSLGGTLDDEGYDIWVDKSGYTYCTGYFSGTVDFDPGAAVFNLTSNNNSRDIYVLKLTPVAMLSWARAMGGADKDYGSHIAVDDSGYVYTVGSFLTTADFDPGAGTQNLSPVFLGGINPDIFISRLNASGNYVWAGSIGGGGTDAAYGFYLSKSGDMYITGMFNDTVDFDPTSATYKLAAVPYGGGYSGFLVKLSNCSKPILSGSISGAVGVCSQSIHTYSITATGATSYQWTLPGGWTGTSVTNSINVTVGASGGVIKVSAVNGCGLSVPLTLNVTVNPKPTVTLTLAAIDTQCVNVSSVVLSGGLPAGGVYSGTAVSAGNFSPATAGVGTFAIQYKYTAAGCSDSATANMFVDVCAGIEPPDENAWYIYPNPFHTEAILTVNGSLPRSFVLYDMMGEQVGAWPFVSGQLQLDLSGLASGIYLLQSANEYETTIQKLVKK